LPTAELSSLPVVVPKVLTLSVVVVVSSPVDDKFPVVVSPLVLPFSLVVGLPVVALLLDEEVLLPVVELDEVVPILDEVLPEVLEVDEVVVVLPEVTVPAVKLFAS
jgi:hypothetical protein